MNVTESNGPVSSSHSELLAEEFQATSRTRLISNRIFYWNRCVFSCPVIRYNEDKVTAGVAKSTRFDILKDKV